MSAAPDLRVGWCPGARMPMMSGDGLIVRVKPRGATLSIDHAIALADAARRHGNGLLDLTARANLQIRGVSEATLPALTTELDALGLLDAEAGAEARRNVVTSPLAGLDPTAAFDIRPAVASLEARLGAEARLATLPAKFGIAVSDGGALRLDDVAADLRFDARPDGRFAVRRDGDGRSCGSCAAEAMPEVAVGLAAAFAEAAERDGSIRRMRDLVARNGIHTSPVDGLDVSRFALLPLRGEGPQSRDEGGRRHAPGIVPLIRPVGHLLPEGEKGGTDPRSGCEAPIVRSAGEDRPQPSPMTRIACVGPIALGRLSILGVAAPFGRLDAAQLDALARGARQAGASDLRITPWRAVLVPGLAPAAAARLAAAVAEVGLIVDPADPRLSVAACPGAPGCRRGTTAVLDHAARWATLLGPGAGERGIVLHVSGCAKGCAHPGPATLTLVAQDGCYALVAGGTAADAAATGPRFVPDDVPLLLQAVHGGGLRA